MKGRIDSRAEIARLHAQVEKLQDQLDKALTGWSVSQDCYHVTSQALDDIYRNVERWNNLQISSRVRRSLEDCLSLRRRK